MDDVSGVVLLENKSLELLQAGRVECAADYERRALAAAEALGAEDCLIVAKLSRFVANTTYGTELKRWRTTGATPQYAPCWSLLMAAATTLQRRRAAGTLLFGCCRPAETTYERRTTEHFADTSACRHARDAASTVAQFIGYTAFLEVASLAQGLIFVICLGDLVVSAEQLHACVTFMADAVEVFLQPRPFEDLQMGAEGDFVRTMKLMELVRWTTVLTGGEDGTRFVRNLQRLNEQSGILERRRVQVSMEMNQSVRVDGDRAAAAVAAAPGMRLCSLKACSACEPQKGAFKACGACRGVVYCCKEHQALHWKAHKAACKASRKTAAVNADT